MYWPTDSNSSLPIHRDYLLKRFVDHSFLLNVASVSLQDYLKYAKGMADCIMALDANIASGPLYHLLESIWHRSNNVNTPIAMACYGEMIDYIYRRYPTSHHLHRTAKALNRDMERFLTEHQHDLARSLPLNYLLHCVDALLKTPQKTYAVTRFLEFLLPDDQLRLEEKCGNIDLALTRQPSAIILKVYGHSRPFVHRRPQQPVYLGPRYNFDPIDEPVYPPIDITTDLGITLKKPAKSVPAEIVANSVDMAGIGVTLSDVADRNGDLNLPQDSPLYKEITGKKPRTRPTLGRRGFSAW